MPRRIFLPALPEFSSVFKNFGDFQSLRDFDNTIPAFYDRKVDYRIDENDNEYLIEVDMPGIKKDDLEIGIKENVLSISAERKKESKDEKGKEVVISRYEQSFNISAKGVDVDNIEADLKNGILTVKLPKKEEPKYEKKITVKE